MNITKWLAFALTALIGVLLSCPDCAAKSDYETALELYGRKQYAPAAQYFEAASLHNPGNAAANYYAGYCFYLAGRRNEAIASFQRLATASPSTKEGIQAQTFLKSLDPNYEKNSGAASTNTSAKQQRAAASTKRLLTAREVVDELVEVRRSNGKFPNVTPEFVEKIKGLLAAMPISVLTFWNASGGSVIIAPSVVEVDFRMQNTVPRGWDQDSTWKDSPAFTHGTQCVVSQYKTNPRNGEDNSQEIGVVRHESGHAIDYCLGNFTRSNEDYKHAYYLDCGTVPDEHRRKLDYYLQKAAGGPSETFAELFCYRMGGETDSYRKEICELVHKDFPLCDKQLDTQLANLAKFRQE